MERKSKPMKRFAGWRNGEAPNGRPTQGIFPGIRRRENWPFPNPEDVQGSPSDQLDAVRKIRDSIKGKISEFFDLAG